MLVIPKRRMWCSTRELLRSRRRSDGGKTTVACSHFFAWARSRRAIYIVEDSHVNRLHPLCMVGYHAVKEFASFRVSCRVISRPLSPFVSSTRRTPAVTHWVQSTPRQTVQKQQSEISTILTGKCTCTGHVSKMLVSKAVTA